jgi:PII-like signaling protein
LAPKPASPPGEPAERPARPAGKLASGPSEATDRTAWATKLTVYLGRQERALGAPAFVAICELLRRRGIAGATAILGVDGTARGLRRRARFLARNAEVPMMIIAVGSGERIDHVLPELGGLLREPLLTLERVRVCKLDGELLATPHELPEVDEHGRAMWQKLTVYSSHAATHDGAALHLELIRRLRESKASGATSLAGIWGFHGDHAPHGDRFFQTRRHVPVVTVIIDTSEQIARSFQIVDQLTSEAGLVTSEMIPAMSAVSESAGRGALRLPDHDA